MMAEAAESKQLYAFRLDWCLATGLHLAHTGAHYGLVLPDRLAKIFLAWSGVANPNRRLPRVGPKPFGGVQLIVTNLPFVASLCDRAAFELTFHILSAGITQYFF